MSTAENGRRQGGRVRSVAHYIRISTEEQKKGYSTRNQHRRLDEHSEREDHDDLGLKVVAHPEGTLEASWRFGGATLLNSSYTSKNKHATKQFHSTEHPLAQSFEPGEDWIWCYVDEVIMEPSN